MATQTRLQLKEWFTILCKPITTRISDLLDSYLNLKDDVYKESITDSIQTGSGSGDFSAPINHDLNSTDLLFQLWDENNYRIDSAIEIENIDTNNSVLHYTDLIQGTHRIIIIKL